ncbi:uncharacterized protein LOC144098270 [Amblyomma americanum]
MFRIWRSCAIVECVLLPQLRVLHGKIHRELDNEYFHGVLENLPDLKGSVMPQPNKNIVREFLDASYAAVGISARRFAENSLRADARSCIESKYLKPLIADVVADLPATSYEGLKCVLISLCLWPQTESTTTPQFKLLWNALDRECSVRCAELDKRRQLLLADCFYHLKLSRITNYNRTMLRVLGRVIGKLKAQEVVQYLYYTNLQRWMVREVKRAIEEKLLSCFNELSIAEVGIACQSFFKCQEAIGEKNLLDCIVKSLERNAAKGDSPVVGAIAKALRYSRSGHDTSLWQNALAACEPCARNWTPSTVAQVTTLATALKSYYPGLLDVALQHIGVKLTTVRLKEITRTLRAVALFNHDCDGIERHLESILQELSSCHRKSEIEAHHHTFVSAMWYLAVIGIYSDGLLAMALNDDQMRGSPKHMDVSFHAEALQSSVQIEHPQYMGPWLSEQTLESLRTERHLIGRDLDQKTTGLVRTERATLEIANRLRAQYGDVCHVTRALSHHHYPDILLSVEKPGGELRVSKCKLGRVRTAWKPQEEGSAIPCAIVVHGPGSYSTNCGKLLGIENMKLRQLSRIGFQVIEVPHFRLSQMSRSAFDHWIELQLQAVQQVSAE